MLTLCFANLYIFLLLYVIDYYTSCVICQTHLFPSHSTFIQKKSYNNKNHSLNNRTTKEQQQCLSQKLTTLQVRDQKIIPFIFWVSLWITASLKILNYNFKNRIYLNLAYVFSKLSHS